jgi:DNA-binding transcriptional ArsR family regulator
MKKRSSNVQDVTAYAAMFAAMGNDARLRIVRLLLSAHPAGVIAGEIQSELGIPASTLSHHLEKLRDVELVCVRREGTFLWYTANTDVLTKLLGFLYAECCTRNQAVQPQSVVQIGK